MDSLNRHLRYQIEDGLEWARVILIHGARQSGKTTLARMIAQERGGTYVSMDDEVLRASILEDPITFLSHQSYPLVIDEVQLGGDRLVLAVKRMVDEERTPGRFILTGSTNFFTVSGISESLAGRIQIYRLWPLSEAEITGTSPTQIDSWFKGHPEPISPPRLDRDEYLKKVCRGGYPEVVDLPLGRRSRWFQGYLDTVVQRDIVALADIRKDSELESLLRWTASLTGRPVNLSDASRKLGISRPTVTYYLGWLLTVFLVHQLPPWSRSLAGGVGRRPKFYLTDSGLAAAMQGTDAASLSSPTSPLAGSLLKTFVIGEIARQLSASERRVNLSHYRDHKGREIDLILSETNGNLVAVEIKATTSPRSQHLDHLRWFREKLDKVAPGTFRAGLLLHTGDHSLPMGDRLYVRPIDCLWSPPQS